MILPRAASMLRPTSSLFITSSVSTKLRHCRLKVISTSPERPPKKEIDAEHPPRPPDGAGGRHKLDLSEPRGDDSLVKEAVN